MLDLRIMGTFKDIQVIGPTTSINGVMLGPGYYYFNLPAYWIGNGDPQVLIYWNIFWFLVAGLAIFIFFLKRDIWLGLGLTTAYLFSPFSFEVTSFFWNANSMYYVMVFYCLSLWLFVEHKTPKNAIFLGIISSVLLASQKNKKLAFSFFVGAFPWFLPQILFEFTKGFPMTKIFFTSSGLLGDKLSFVNTLNSHSKNYFDYFNGQFFLPKTIEVIVFFVTLLFCKVSKYFKQVKLFSGFIAFSFLFYVFVYHYELKV